jgi:sucrose-6-phosphate hydrolase SacC (GH32 family)
MGVSMRCAKLTWRSNLFNARRDVLVPLLVAMAFCAPHIAATGAPGASSSAGYLLVHFTGDSADGEQIYFATSSDGLHWQDLNHSQPVLRSDLGDKGVRDPSIIRSADGKKFYILATDLRMANGKGWDAAMHKGSTSLIIFESTDLVHWSRARKVDVAGAIPGAGCAWAPEAIYDDTTGEYVVYWATISPLNGIDKPRIYYSKTRDFVTFTPAKIYIDRPEAVGIIDTQIVKMDDASSGYRYYRASGDGQITLEGSQRILGEWKTIGDLRAVGLTGKQVEGPILYKINSTGQWALWVDQFAAGKGYLSLVSSDLSRADNFRILRANEYSLGQSQKRHGSILSITPDEYRQVLSHYSQPR